MQPIEDFVAKEKKTKNTPTKKKKQLTATRDECPVRMHTITSHQQGFYLVNKSMKLILKRAVISPPALVYIVPMTSQIFYFILAVLSHVCRDSFVTFYAYYFFTLKVCLF